MRRRGFTLIELLVVIAIISLLTAILFPVFASVRGKARQAVCASNMRQIGMAIAMYSQDNDDLYPFAVDPSDKYTTPNIWTFVGLSAPISVIPLLNSWPGATPTGSQPGVVTPYLKSNEVWHCPADTGFDTLDNYPIANNLIARPTFYQSYGTSYLERTEIAFDSTTQAPRMLSSLVGYGPNPPCAEHGLSEINILQDGNGSWHGGTITHQKRYNMLMADGHVINMTRKQFDDVWAEKLDRPNGCN